MQGYTPSRRFGYAIRIAGTLACVGLSAACAGPPNYVQQGNELLQQRKFDDAINLYLEALAEQPENGALHLGLGTAYLNAGKTDFAEKTLAIAAQKGEKVRANIIMARLRRRQKDYEGAAALLNEALSAAPDSWELHFELGEIQLIAGDVNRAAESFQSVVTLKPDFLKGYVQLASALKKLTRFDEAIEVLRSVRQSKKGKPLSRLQTALGEVYEASGDLMEADRAYRRAVTHDPKNFRAVAGQARAMRYAGQAAEAIQLLNGALRDNPKSGELYYEVGIAYREFRVPEKALESLLKAVELEPGLVRAFTPLLELLKDDEKKREVVYGVLAKAAAAMPEDVETQMRFAQAAYDKKDDAAAMAAARRVIELKPSHVEGNYVLGLAQGRSGKREDAMETYEALVILDPAKADELLTTIENSSGPAAEPRAKGKRKKRKKRKRKRR